MSSLAPRNRWVWIAFGCAFLVLELLAALHVVPWPTLSSSTWYWLPTWYWWLLPTGLLVSLIAHLSPRRTSAAPVGIFGGAMCGRIIWVEHAWWLAAAALVCALLAWWFLWPGEYLCVDKEPRCWHRTWLGAWLHRVGFREPGRLP